MKQTPHTLLLGLLYALFLPASLAAQYSEGAFFNTTASELYDERGYERGKALSVDGKLVVSNQNGSLSYTYPISNCLIKGYPVKVDLNYCNAVKFTTFQSYKEPAKMVEDGDVSSGHTLEASYRGWAKFDQNRPAWILGVNGFAMQVIASTVQFHCDSAKFLDPAKATYKDDDFVWMIDGYDYSNKMFNILAAEPLVTEDGSYIDDLIHILRADGSLLELRKTTALGDPDTARVTGMYFVAEANQSGYGIVEYDTTYMTRVLQETLPADAVQRPRKLRYYQGDGLEYVFREWVIPYGTSAYLGGWRWGSSIAGPSIFYLEEINGPGGNVLTFSRARHQRIFPWGYGVEDKTRGRALLTGFEGHRFTYGGSHMTIEAMGRTTTVRFDTVVVDGKARNNLKMPLAEFGGATHTAYHMGTLNDKDLEHRSYLGLVTKIIDPEKRTTRFSYDPYTRVYRDYGFPPNAAASDVDVVLKNWRLTKVIEPTASYTLQYYRGKENPLLGAVETNPDTTKDSVVLWHESGGLEASAANPYALNNVAKKVVKRDRLSAPLTTQAFTFDYDINASTGGAEVVQATQHVTDHVTGLTDTTLQTYSRLHISDGVPWHPDAIYTAVSASVKFAAGVKDETRTWYGKTGQIVLPVEAKRYITQNGQTVVHSQTDHFHTLDRINSFGGNFALSNTWGWGVVSTSSSWWQPDNNTPLLKMERTEYLHLGYADTTFLWRYKKLNKFKSFENYYQSPRQGWRILEPESAIYDTNKNIGVYDWVTDTVTRRIPPHFNLVQRKWTEIPNPGGSPFLSGIGHRYYREINNPYRLSHYGLVIEDTVIGTGGADKIVSNKYTYGGTGSQEQNLIVQTENANGARTQLFYTFSAPEFYNAVTQLHSPKATVVNNHNGQRDTTLINFDRYATAYNQPAVDRKLVRTTRGTGIDTTKITQAFERSFFGQARGSLDPNGWLARYEHDNIGRLRYVWMPFDYPRDTAVETVSYDGEFAVPLVSKTTFKRRIDTTKCTLDGLHYVGSNAVGGLYTETYYDSLFAFRPVMMVPECRQCNVSGTKEEERGSLLSLCNPPYPYDIIDYDLNDPLADFKPNGYVAHLLYYPDGTLQSAVDLDSLYIGLYVSAMSNEGFALRVWHNGNLFKTYLFDHPSIGDVGYEVTNPLTSQDQIGRYLKIDLLNGGISVGGYNDVQEWTFEMMTAGKEIHFVPAYDGADVAPRLVMKGRFSSVQTTDYTLAMSHIDDPTGLKATVSAKVDDSLHSANKFDHSVVQAYSRHAEESRVFGADNRVLKSYRTIVDAGGALRIDSTVSAFTGGGLTRRVTDQEGDSIVTRYDALGRPIEVKHADGTVSTIAYIIGRPEDCGIAGHDQEWWSYCSAKIVTNENGVRHGEYRDCFDRLRRRVADIDGLALATRFEYDILNRPTIVLNPKGDTTKYAYDPFGRVRAKSQPDLGTISYAYDKMGNVRFTQTEEQANHNRVSFSQYDDLNRPTLFGEAGLGDPPSAGRYTDEFNGGQLYDGVSTVLTAGAALWRDPEIPVPTFWSPSQLTISGCFLQPDTLLGESLSDQPVQLSLRHPVRYYQPVTTPLAARADFENISRYPHFARLAVAYDRFPDRKGPVWSGLPSQTQWDALAPKGKVRNGIGKEVAVAYRDHGGEPFHYTVMSFDERGRVEALLRYTENLGFDAVYYTYNSMNRVTSIRVADPLRQYTTWYGYDHNGRVDSTWTSLQPAGNGLGVGAPAFKPQTLQHPAQNADVVYSYTKTGQVETMRYPPVNVLVEYAYNHRQWLDSMVASQGGANLFRQLLRYDPTGQITGQDWQHGAGPLQMQGYGYDDADRLEIWTPFNGTGTEYVYDAAGNRTAKHLRNGAAIVENSVYQYDPVDGPNRLERVTMTTPLGTTMTDYTYNGNGAVTAVRHTPLAGPVEEDNFTYSDRGLLTQYRNVRTGMPGIAPGPFQDWRYRYNAMGEREQKRVYLARNSGHGPNDAAGWVYYALGGNKAQYAVYHGQEFSAGCDTAGGPVVYMYPTEYLTYGVGDAANLVTVPLFNQPAGVKEFKIADHLGSTRVTLRPGMAPKSTDHAPFGEVVTGLEPRKGYLDKETDRESGKGDFGHRKYSTSLGRFLSTDRLWEQYPGLSPYAYSANNPLRCKDPSGDSIAFICARAEEAKAMFEMALNYMKSKGVDVSQLEELRDRKDIIVFFEITDRIGMDSYGSADQTMLWNPYSATKLTNGGLMSPARSLLHELSHAYLHLTDKKGVYDKLTMKKDKQYDDAEERRVIEDIENPAGVLMGEGTRNDHKGTGYLVADPTSTTPVVEEKKK